MTPTPVRIVTAAALFDGHDAAITVIRRVLQARGAEVIHLGHDRSVDEVVAAVIEEDAHGVGISSYQGGHLEYFGYLVDRLAKAGSDATWSARTSRRCMASSSTSRFDRVARRGASPVPSETTSTASSSGASTSAFCV